MRAERPACVHPRVGLSQPADRRLDDKALCQHLQGVPARWLGDGEPSCGRQQSTYARDLTVLAADPTSVAAVATDGFSQAAGCCQLVQWRELGGPHGRSLGAPMCFQCVTAGH